MNKSYWMQKAAPWVSASVMIGGLITAGILFFLVKLELGFQQYETRISIPSEKEFRKM